MFLASGATSLVYEVIFERRLHLVVGTSQLSVITTLAAFMTGLAFGGFLGSRIADKAARPLQVYARLEAIIGAYALIFPVLIFMARPIYTTIWRLFEPGPVVLGGVQFVLMGLIMLPPTICMGATLPLLARFAANTPDSAGQTVGRLYGANTLGAVLGVALSGFLLLPLLGLWITTCIAAVGNFALAWIAHNLGEELDALPGETAEDEGWPAFAPWLAAIACLGGLASLIYEVSWFRVMVLNLGGSAYAFTIMLLAFLVGIGTGGWAGGPIADRAQARSGVGGVLKLIFWLQLGVGLLAWMVMFLFNELPFIFVSLFTAVEQNLAWLWPAKLLLALGVMLPPCLLMGATFPALVRAATHGRSLGRPVGWLYGWNTVGAIGGAMLGGLWLLPSLHVTGTMLVAVSLNLIGAALALHTHWSIHEDRPTLPRRAGLGLGILAAIVALHTWPPPWDKIMMTAGMYKYVSDLGPEERSRQDVLDFAVEPYELVFYDEGLSSVVTVALSKKTGNLWMANNGKVDASTNVDMPTQVLVAHLPFVYHPEPDDVLVIGLASGITAGSVTLHRAMKRIDIVEIEPAVVEASHLFDPYNHRPLEDPRVNLITNDGRNHLVLMPDATYDLVVSEPSNPWLTGVSNLFTRDFWELGKRKLKPGGVWAQWVQMYGMDPDDLRALLAAYTEVFPYVHLYSTIEDADLVLIGSAEPLHLHADQVDRMMGLDQAVVEDLAAIGCMEPEDIVARFQLNHAMLRSFVGDVPPNTDDNMRVEYSAPLNLHEDTANHNFFLLLGEGGARGMVPFDAVVDAEGRVDLARAYARREDYVRALITLKEAEVLEPGSQVVAELYVEYQELLHGLLDASD
jgi:spermidine synthase